ncbi:MAG: GerW family sporulation protein [Clostridia bacterium]
MNDEQQHPIEKIMNDAMGKLKGMVDGSTVIGEPIKLGDTFLLPLSKVSLGYVAGGGEYSEKNGNNKKNEYPFSGGSGGGLSVSPIGFLYVNNGNVKIIKVDGESSFEKLLLKLPEMISGMTHDIVHEEMKK